MVQESSNPEQNVYLTWQSSQLDFLKNLLSKITKQNLHKEQDFGKAQGKEIW